MEAASRRLLLTVHSATPGGSQRMALAEAEYLKRFYELLIAVPRGPLQRDFAAHGELVAAPRSLPLWGGAGVALWSRRLAATALDAARMAALVRRRGVAAVVTNSGVSLSPLLAARLARVPVLVHARDTLPSRLAPAVWRLHGALASTVVAISDAAAEPFAAARARLAVIADGVALPPRPAPRPVPAAPRIVVAGTLDRNKGQDVAVRMVARLPRAQLDLVGPVADPAFAAEVGALAERLGVAGRVRRRGPVDGPERAFAGADVVVVPSRGEQTPLAALEALVRELPVVAARVGGLPGIVRDGETGLLAEPEDPAAFAAAVARLVEDPATARAMAARGRADVAERYGLERSLAALHGEIERLVGGGSAA